MNNKFYGVYESSYYNPFAPSIQKLLGSVAILLLIVAIIFNNSLLYVSSAVFVFGLMYSLFDEYLYIPTVYMTIIKIKDDQLVFKSKINKEKIISEKFYLSKIDDVSIFSELVCNPCPLTHYFYFKYNGKPTQFTFYGEPEKLKDFFKSNNIEFDVTERSDYVDEKMNEHFKKIMEGKNEKP